MVSNNYLIKEAKSGSVILLSGAVESMPIVSLVFASFNLAATVHI